MLRAPYLLLAVALLFAVSVEPAWARGRGHGGGRGGAMHSRSFHHGGHVTRSYGYGTFHGSATARSRRPIVTRHGGKRPTRFHRGKGAGAVGRTSLDSGRTASSFRFRSNRKFTSRHFRPHRPHPGHHGPHVTGLHASPVGEVVVEREGEPRGPLIIIIDP